MRGKFWSINSVVKINNRFWSECIIKGYIGNFTIRKVKWYVFEILVAALPRKSVIVSIDDLRDSNEPIKFYFDPRTLPCTVSVPPVIWWGVDIFAFRSVLTSRISSKCLEIFFRQRRWSSTSKSSWRNLGFWKHCK